MNMTRRSLTVAGAALAVAVATIASPTARASDASDAKELVTKAQATIGDIGRNPDFPTFSPALAKARGVLIFPQVLKAGFILGGSGGSGVLNFRGRSYGLSSGGLDYGLVFGGSKTVLRGRVSNINRPSDVAGVYGAAGAGLAVGRGARAIVLTNQKGAVLELSGYQTGLMANADLSGLAITMR